MTPDNHNDELSPFRPSSFGTIATINAKLFGAFAMAVTAYFVWPTSSLYWGFGVLSIILGAGAVISLAVAIGTMIQLYMRDRIVANCMMNARVPSSSRLATEEELKKWEMQDE